MFLDRRKDLHAFKGSLIKEKIHMGVKVPYSKKYLISVEEFHKYGKGL